MQSSGLVRQRQPTLLALFASAVARCSAVAAAAVSAMPRPASSAASTPSPSSSPAQPITRSSGSSAALAPARGVVRVRDEEEDDEEDVILADLIGCTGTTTSAATTRPPQRSRPPPRLTQATLDVGQSALAHGTRCPLCDMLYTPADAGDAALHRRFCNGQRRRRRRATPHQRTETASPSTATAAVRLLEELACVSACSSPNTRTPPCDRRRRRAVAGRGGAATAESTAVRCTRSRVPALPSAAAAGPSSSAEVFHIALDAHLLRDGAGVGGAVVELLELLGFTAAVLRAADAAVHGGVSPVVHVVCIVDVSLRLLRCAVVGQPRVREQEPELCVECGLDGSHLCRTRQHWTHGDVLDLWVGSPAELRTARAAWEKTSAAPFASTRQAVATFFGPRGGGGAAAVPADDGVCESVGAALHTLAHLLLYGCALSPARQLSYSRVALAAAAAAAAAAAHGGPDVVERSLAAVSGAYAAVADPAPRADVDSPQPLYTHGDDNSEDSSDDDAGDTPPRPQRQRVDA
ncbi:zinc-finger of acetyl-transferase ESCO [Novymonas esmeraldas]|uniref:Zinc-finger of acetyl-transferase ESCO n=1 Tax=Novymonas esmeraldas TaxID=1808958 RepID=A0AAW0EPY8_9TRYP